MRVAVAVASILLSAINLAAAKEADAAVRRSTNIPAQRLESALETLAKERHFQILYRTEVVGQLQASGAVGEFTVQETLEKLLSGTGLTYKYLDDSAITIVPIGAATASGAQSLHSVGESTKNPTAADEPSSGTEKEVPKSLWQRFRLAQVEAGDTTRTAEPGVTDDSADVKRLMLEEIIVTAQKRQERLQDVPVPVTAISTPDLVASNLVRLQDYYTKIPSLSFTPSIQSAQNLAIRGITTGFANPTVGVTVDDIPYGSALGITGGLQVPDLDPSELERIEVLRGPQGTLYGASSMGGLLKFVTADPSTETLQGRVQAGISSVENGDDVGYSVRAAANMPLSESVALRASGFTREDPGFIDNVRTGEKGVNSAKFNGGRISALWRPSDTFSLKLSALHQEAKGDGASEADLLPGLGELEQDRARNSGWFDRESQVYSIVATAALGPASLDWVSGYGIHEIADVFDFTYSLGGTTQGRFGVRGTPVRTDTKNEKFTQEIRFSMPLGSRVQWLLGGFYSNENSRFGQTITATDVVSGAVAGTFFTFSRPYEFDEIAAFTNVTFQITDRFDLQLGGRQSRQEQSSGPTPSLGLPPFGTGSPVVTPKLDGEPEDVFTYLVTPRFRVSPDLMVYARFSSGYRGGAGGSSGPNDRCVLFNYPCQYEADETRNYELGMKGNALNGVFSFDASLYYIDWQDIQIQALHPQAGATYNTNGSSARSQGAEFSMQSTPFDGTTIAAWGAWNDAELTEAFPPGPLFGADGDRLPLSSRWSGNLSVDQEFALATNLTAALGASVTYIGSRKGLFTATSARAAYPDYTRVDLHGGVRRDSWALDLFVNNVTDKRASLSGGTGFFPPYSVVYIQPRTIGVSLMKTF